jgi:hypothetical protein
LAASSPSPSAYRYHSLAADVQLDLVEPPSCALARGCCDVANLASEGFRTTRSTFSFELPRFTCLARIIHHATSLLWIRRKSSHSPVMPRSPARLQHQTSCAGHCSTSTNQHNCSTSPCSASYSSQSASLACSSLS